MKIGNKESDGKQKTTNKSLIQWIKENPTLAKILGIVILFTLGLLVLIILVAVIVRSVTSLLSVFFGINEDKIFENEKYNEKNLVDITEMSEGESCYKASYSNWFERTWKDITDGFKSGINSPCELIELVRFKTEQAEIIYSNFGLELSPGLIISTIIYTYYNQALDENYNTAIDTLSTFEILEAIVQNKILTENDIDEIIDGMIFKNKYFYYTCETGALNECDGNSSSKTCTEKLFLDVYFSKEKYNVFLRYGINIANAYEASVNHNDSLHYICDTCYKKFYDDQYYLIQTDTEKFLSTLEESGKKSIKLVDEEYLIFKKEVESTNSKVPQRYDSSFIINSEYDYTYRNGFIYSKYGNLDTDDETGFTDEELVKQIDHNVDVIFSYAKTEDGIYGRENVESGTKGKSNSTYKITNYSDEFCSEDNNCSCSNNNLRPAQDIEGFIGIDPSVSKFENEQVCNIFASEEKFIRLITCPGYDDAQTRLPGGGRYLDTKDLGDRYIANDLISWKEYIIGVALKEMSSGNPIEALKFQMLLAQTYAINRFLDGSAAYSYFNNELQIVVGTCSQSYSYKNYKDAYLSGKKQKELDEAYEEIKPQILVDQNDEVVFAGYGSKLQNEVISMAQNGLTYTTILEQPYIRNYSKSNSVRYYENARIESCNGTGNSQDPVFVNNLITNARQFVGFTRKEFASATGVDTSGSWCARFVSYVLGKTPNNPFNISSASVSSYMTYLVNNNRFCHSDYWASKSGMYKCANSPEPGDLILFAQNTCDYKGNGHMPTKTGNCFRHIGIVSKVEGDTITYIHGNTTQCKIGNAVCETTVNRTDSYIVGYGR